MTNFKFSIKNILSLLFVVSVTITGILTISFHPIEIAGGLARGYLDTPSEESIFKKIGNGFKTFETRINEYFVFHDVSVNAYGGIQKLLGVSLIDDSDPLYEVLKLNNDYLTFKQTGAMSYNSTLDDYLISLKEVCDESHTDLLYVNKLDKDTTDNELLPAYYPFAYESDYPEFENNMDRYSINTLDLNRCVDEQGLDKYSLFFKSDHHWLPSTGLWASKMISENCNSKFGYKLDSSIYDLSNYDIEKYEKSFLGSQGRRVGTLYSPIDDFEVITPKYDTKMQFDIDSKDIHKEGTFEDVMIYRENITPDSFMKNKNLSYHIYMSGNYDLVKIENACKPQGKTCIYVMDSFGCTVAPFLSQNFKTMYCVDTRHFEENLFNFIYQIKPDIVIYMVSWHQT